jgi:hypothetical protein
MKKYLQFLILGSITALVLSSCHKGLPKQTKYIPKDASFVLGIDPKSLAGKLSGSNIAMDSLFKTFGDTGFGAHLGIKNREDIKNSGIDWQGEFFVFINSYGSVMNGRTTSMGVVAAMKSTSDFEAFLKKDHPSIDIKKTDTYSYAVLQDGFVAGWNSDVIVLSNVFKTNHTDDNTSPQPGRPIASQKQLDALFTQKEDASVASIDKFRDLVTQSADMLFWSNSSNTIASIPFLGMTKAADLLTDSYGAGTINFENGKVKMVTKAYPGKDLSDILSKYAGPTVDMSMVNRYPAPVNGYALFSFNPQIIGAVIKFIGVDGMANQFLQQAGFSLDDILNVFKGDFGIVFSDLGSAKKPNEFSPGDSVKTYGGKIILNATIADKKSYDKIASVLAAKGMMAQQNGQYVFPQMNGYTMNIDDKNLIIASDPELLREYKEGASGKAGVPNDIAGRSKGSAVAFYIDIASLLKTVPAESPEATTMLNEAQQTFKNIIATSGNFNGKTVDGVFELNTVNDNENSLVLIIKYASVMAKEMQAYHPMFTPHMPIPDSTIVPGN